MDSWWGDAGGVENDLPLSVDGSNYFSGQQSLSGWAGFFWRKWG
ncbi:MAG: hypothetical protein R2788_02930 [Saprospiraceae bacterium]